jgi:ankyrin repeat protein
MTDSPLILAVRQFDKPSVESLLRSGVNINETGERGLTALHTAVWNVDAPMVALLLQHMPNLSIRTHYKELPIDMAVARVGDERIVAMLVAAGSPLNSRTIICEAASRGATVVQRLIARGVVISDVRDEVGENTPLHLAMVRPFKRDLLHTLVHECGIDINAVQVTGQTSVHLAACSGNVEQLQWLIEAGAKIDCMNVRGCTPLHELGAHNVVNLAQSTLLLLAAGADPNTLSAGDRVATPCHFAVEPTRGGFQFAVPAPGTIKMAIVHALLGGGADLDLLDGDGRSARQILTKHARHIDTNEVERARRRISFYRIAFVRKRALQVCIGLQPLALDALQTCEILVHACGPLAPLVAFHQWWKIVTTVKHFEQSDKV